MEPSAPSPSAPSAWFDDGVYSYDVWIESFLIQFCILFLSFKPIIEHLLVPVILLLTWISPLFGSLAALISVTGALSPLFKRAAKRIWVTEKMYVKKGIFKLKKRAVITTVPYQHDTKFSLICHGILGSLYLAAHSVVAGISIYTWHMRTGKRLYWPFDVNQGLYVIPHWANIALSLSLTSIAMYAGMLLGLRVGVDFGEGEDLEVRENMDDRSQTMDRREKRPP